jgi:hypothetical protein
LQGGFEGKCVLSNKTLKRKTQIAITGRRLKKIIPINRAFQPILNF